jgi:CubicO group peptidase (beta-lactamase class C family)
LSVENTVTEILGDECPEGYDPYWNETTVDMLMRHRTGYPGGFDTDVFDASQYDEDYLKEIMLKKWVCSPDTERHYEDAGYYILSRIVNKVSGKPLFNFCWENIFLPLKFKEAAWSCCPEGHAIGATGLYIRTEDMIKLGGVYLNNGEYLGKRIVSEEWVKKVLERTYEFAYNGIKDSYNKGGMNGQELLVIPCENRVIAWQGYDTRKNPPDLTKYAAEYNFK